MAGISNPDVAPGGANEGTNEGANETKEEDELQQTKFKPPRKPHVKTPEQIKK